jgi:hypothetical protein
MIVEDRDYGVEFRHLMIPCVKGGYDLGIAPHLELRFAKVAL